MSSRFDITEKAVRRRTWRRSTLWVESSRLTMWLSPSSVFISMRFCTVSCSRLCTRLSLRLTLLVSLRIRVMYILLASMNTGSMATVIMASTASMRSR